MAAKYRVIRSAAITMHPEFACLECPAKSLMPSDSALGRAKAHVAETGHQVTVIYKTKSLYRGEEK